MHVVGVARCCSAVAWVVLAVPFLSAGCIPFIPADGYTQVDGIVVDDLGVPIGGVTITFCPQPTQANLIPPFVGTTDDQGQFFVGSTHRPVTSQFIVEAKKEGYRPTTITVEGCKVHRGVRIVMVRESSEPAASPSKTKD
ncbi:MAG: hypothetical protein WHT09_13385 [Thermogutta sp.]